MWIDLHFRWLSNTEAKNIPNVIVGDLNWPEINWHTFTGFDNDVYSLFLSCVIETSYIQLVDFPTRDPYNFELYRFKFGACFLSHSVLGYWLCCITGGTICSCCLGPMNGSCLCLLISVVYCMLVKACVLLLNSLNSMIPLYSWSVLTVILL